MPSKRKKNKILKGIGVSHGIAIGKIFIYEGFGPKIRKFSIDSKDVGEEISRFLNAMTVSKNQLLEIKKNESKNIGSEYSFILDTHIMMAEDEFLKDNTIEAIKIHKFNAEWTLKESLNILMNRFSKVNDEYLRERRRDIEHVGNRIIHNLMGRKKESSLFRLEDPSIVIANDLSASDTAQMKKEKILGFATDAGGRTSHTGIIASALKIPAIVGLNNISTFVENGDFLIIDGESGIVVINPYKETIEEYLEKQEKYSEYKKMLFKTKEVESITKDGICVKLKANLEYDEDIPYANKLGAMGVGLFRSELFYLNKKRLPSEEELFRVYKKLAIGTKPYSAIIRTLDIGGDKIISFMEETHEANPALGLRGIRFCLENSKIFKTQLRAILRASAFGNIKVMYPMITMLEEVQQANDLLRETMYSLNGEGIKFNKSITVGAMIETPSAAQIVETLAEEVDFFSIGTNDLIQYTFAIDRKNEKVAHLYQPFHPAILKTIKSILSAAERTSTPVDVCGMVGGDPLYIIVLLGLGKIHSLSMVPQSIPEVKNLIRSIRLEDSISLCNEVLTLKTAAAVEALVKEKAVEWKLNGNVNVTTQVDNL